MQYVAPQRSYGTGDHGLVYAIIATVAVLFCCFYFGLVCTIPAIVISIGVSLVVVCLFVCFLFAAVVAF